MSSIRRQLITACLGLVALSAQANPLEVSLTPGPSEGTVTVNLSNTSSQAVSILSWDTPFESTLSSDVFRIERITKEWPLVESAPYIGREVKRAAPDADNYLTVEAGASVSHVVELNDYYQIDKSDTRQVRFVGDIRYVENAADQSAITTRKVSSPAELDVSKMESNSLTVSVQPAIERRVLTPAYNSCSVDEQTDILAAANVAEQLVITAVEDLTGLAVDARAGSPRYSTWFGEYTEARFNRVVSNFESMETALQEETLRFDCGCDEQGTYAYVYPNRPYDIFLCPEFRRSNIDGTDSQAGTIIHELSHFTILADTDDHVYSQRGAQSLASSDPDKAIANADNHEYFAENTPFLDIEGESTTPGDVEHTLLELDTPVTGNLAINESATFQVEGANRIQLISTGGDADLYVYTDEALTAESCRSLNVSSEDNCENFVDGTVYIQVSAFSATAYELVALGDAETPPVEITATLVLDTPESGSLLRGERFVYAVSGADLLELESLSGDADLYVFDSLDFDNATLVCAAESPSTESTTDSCNVPATGDTYYALVSAFTDAQFTLMASLESTSTDTVSVTTDKGRLTAGETRSDAIPQGDFHIYVLGGASSVQLTSISGDVDLAIYDSLDFENAEMICISEEFSADSVVDSCDIPNDGDHYVAVYGFEGSEYSVTSVARAVVPVEDPEPPVVPVDPEVPVVPVDPDLPVVPDTTPVDPVAPDDDVVPSVSSSSGGGSLGVWGLALLLLGAAGRRRYLFRG